MKDQDGWRCFVNLCLQIQSEEEFETFFDLFLTIEEKNLLASRYKIIQGLLEDKISQRELAKQQSVSIAQITRGSNAMKRIDPKLKKFLLDKL